MFAWGSKYLFGSSVTAYVVAIVYGLVTGGGVLGTLSMGYKGGVGDHFGYTILMALAFSALVAAVISVVVRDGDAEEMSALVGSQTTINVDPPAGTNVWGPLTAFGVGSLIVGVTVSSIFIYLGAATLFVVGIQWLALAWSDNTSGDPAINDAARGRLLGPIEIPLLSLLAIAVVTIGLSRILLAVSQVGSTVVASVAALFVFGSAVLIVKSQAPKQIITAIVATGAVLLLVGAVLSAAAGERDFHHEAEGHSEAGTEAGTHGETETETEAGTQSDSESGDETDGESGGAANGSELDEATVVADVNEGES